MSDIDLFTVGGQSNAKGQGSSGSSPTPPAANAKEYLWDGSLVALDDPVEGSKRDPVPQAETGSAWPAFADTYVAKTGGDICIAGTARDSAAQAAAAESVGGHWDTGSTLYSDAVQKTQDALAALEAAGYTPRFAGVLWCQGERDGAAINDGTITKSTYKTALENMIARFRADLSQPDMPFWIFEVGNYTSQSIRGHQLVRDAQREVTIADDAVWMASDKQKSYQAGRLADGVHYNQGAYNEMGEIGATNVRYHIEAAQ